MSNWLETVSERLATGLVVDDRELLALARDVAHRVDRPATPLTTFLVGYAAGLRGGGAAEVAAVIAQVRGALDAWPSPRED